MMYIKELALTERNNNVCEFTNGDSQYSKTCVNRPLKNRQNKVPNNK